MYNRNKWIILYIATFAVDIEVSLYLNVTLCVEQHLEQKGAGTHRGMTNINLVLYSWMFIGREWALMYAKLTMYTYRPTLLYCHVFQGASKQNHTCPIFFFIYSKSSLWMSLYLDDKSYNIVYGIEVQAKYSEIQVFSSNWVHM